MPKKFLNLDNSPQDAPGRRAALAWIRKNDKMGVVYFAAGDNVYDCRIFEEIRSTRGVSVFPVGLAKDLQLSTPVVKEGRFSGWYDDFGRLAVPRRVCRVCLLGGAAVESLPRPHANVPWTYDLQEEGLLRGLGVPPEKMEFKAELCTKVFVWHVESKIPNPVTRYLCDTRYDGTNLRLLEKQLTLIYWRKVDLASWCEMQPGYAEDHLINDILGITHDAQDDHNMHPHGIQA
nr:galactosylgalactosylxylosylprotein 3-beta-glucuronosyltransferase S-like [Penaeus vannamei]